MEKAESRKAVAMLSGGLDSILAARLVKEQGIALYAINFLTAFCTCTRKGASCLASESAAKEIGIPLKVVNITKEYLEVVRNPKFGYGKNVNPCLDCRVFTFKKTKQYMEEIGASFIVTGEVLGERPMSQRLEAMQLIEREAGLKGLILRPLSAKLLEPSLPEREGWVDREKLLSISGRGRTPQIALAENFGISDYPCPSGGCLLTYEGFANKVRDLIKHGQWDTDGVRLLKIGRHFRLSEAAKLIVGRDEGENKKLLSLAREGDILLDAASVAGPVGLFLGEEKNGQLELAAGILARYADGTGIKGETAIAYWRAPASTYNGAPDSARREMSVTPFTDAELERYRI